MCPRGFAASSARRSDLLRIWSLVSEAPEAATTCRNRPTPGRLIVPPRRNTACAHGSRAPFLESLNDEDFQTGVRIYMGHCKLPRPTPDGKHRPRWRTARAFGTRTVKIRERPVQMLQKHSPGGAGIDERRCNTLTPKRTLTKVIHFIRERSS